VRFIEIVAIVVVILFMVVPIVVVKIKRRIKLKMTDETTEQQAGTDELSVRGLKEGGTKTYCGSSMAYWMG